jgi:PBSX family phage terminase large subunit
MKQRTEKPFKFQPFSKKQIQVLTWWNENSPVRDKDILIADGSVRAGKTVVMSISFVMWSMENFDEENFAFCGKTIGSLRRNVIKPLKKMLKGRGYSCKDHRSGNDNYLTISKDGKSNDYYLFGGKDEGSQDLIQGITLAGVLFDEVALMPQSFVNQATARCSVDGAKMWFNCNPDGPYHWFKLEYLDNLEEKNALHLHFTMDDNLSLSESVKNRYKTMYSGIFYERYILGLWKLADGLIYKKFSELMNENRGYIYKEPTTRSMFQEINIGFDFGGNKSGHSFVATGITHGYKELIALASERWMEGEERKSDKSVKYEKDINPERLGQLFVNFVEFVQRKYGQVDYIYCDSAEQVLIRGIKTALEKSHIYNVTVRNARKSEINDRIQCTLILMSQLRFFLTDDCESLIKALTTAVWDSKQLTEDIRLDDGTSDIDSLDAFEYSFEKEMKRLIDYR